MRLGRRGDGGRSPRQVWADWQTADEAGDTAAAVALAEELLALTPDSSFSWFQAGLLSKALGNWEESAQRNKRAVELFTPRDAKAFDGDNPAAWNLGIAATALGDWRTARKAWRAYGIELEESDDPIDGEFGFCPVRINPEPAIAHQVLSSVGDTEVIWCWRRSPAHAVVASVPIPESGHRFRDTLLHDGAPRGTRQLDGREVSVFDELVRLEDSGLPTWQAQIIGAEGDDFQALSDLLGPRGLGVDEWSGIRMLCAACSLGSPDVGHTHDAAPEAATRLGLAGGEDELRAAVDVWLDTHRHVVLVDLELLW
jgi:tetratricopeptide (TPR) repeat protein